MCCSVTCSLIHLRYDTYIMYVTGKLGPLEGCITTILMYHVYRIYSAMLGQVYFCHLHNLILFTFQVMYSAAIHQYKHHKIEATEINGLFEPNCEIFFLLYMFSVLYTYKSTNAY